MFKYLFNTRFSNKIRSDLSKMPKTYWFGGMALGITIHLLMSVLWDPSEYSHLLTPPFTFIHILLLGMHIGPIIIFTFLYMRERMKVSDNKEG